MRVLAVADTHRIRINTGHSQRCGPCLGLDGILEYPVVRREVLARDLVAEVIAKRSCMAKAHVQQRTLAATDEDCRSLGSER